MCAKIIDIQQSTDILKGDLLRLVKILEGKLQGNITHIQVR